MSKLPTDPTGMGTAELHDLSAKKYGFLLLDNFSLMGE